MTSSHKLSSLTCAVALLALSAASPVLAEQRLRVQVDQRGDFALIGNTLGWDCGAGASNPVVGQVNNNCGSSTADTSADLFWRSDEPAAGQATASLAISAEMARSSAVLTLPMGAQVTHAFLYWGARKAGAGADTSVQLERPGTFMETITAASSYSLTPSILPGIPGTGIVYQSVADVTTLVVANGPGVYRVSGVEVSPFRDVNEDVLLAGWSLVVLYRLDSDPPRNLAVFDGLDGVLLGTDSNVSLSGFLVPNAGFDAKLGTIVYEGDESIDGDSLLFGTAPLAAPRDELSDTQNPAANFFNGTRSALGMPVSVAGDLPQLAGTASTMAGLDLDVIDVTRRLTAGQTSVNLRATSSLDVYYLGAFITSISTFRPDFIKSEKRVKDVNGGFVNAGDELEYTIIVDNTGNDASANTVVHDPLPMGVTFVPGSINITTGANMGAKTDVAGDDQAVFDPAMRAITVYMGAGATASAGGSIPAGENSTVTFRVKVDSGVRGVISNQARIDAAGARGAPSTSTVTDGNGGLPGTPPTDITTGECQMNSQCSGSRPICDLTAAPPVCVECKMDSQCRPDKPICDVASMPPMCVECTMDSHCKMPTTKCDLTTHTCVCPGAPGSCIDTDGDKLPDPDETEIGTDPKDADTDDDGVRDGDEVDVRVDTDGDGKVNGLDPDSDGDGLNDGTETGRGCDDAATDRARNNCVPDADMGATVTSPINPDSDMGGISDGQEDKNHNGAIDTGEGNPNVACDDNAMARCDPGGYGSLAGAGGCSVPGWRTTAHTAWWLSSLAAALCLVRRRRTRQRDGHTSQ
jgi:clumping factor A